MARRKKASKEETYDSFHCSVDCWRRDYSFGIKRWEIPGLETDKPFREMDHLVVTGTVVSHDTNRMPNRRKFKTIELNLVPTHVPRDEWRKDLEAVGHAWTEKGEKGKLREVVHLPANVFYSLIPCLAIPQPLFLCYHHDSKQPGAIPSTPPVDPAQGYVGDGGGREYSFRQPRGEVPPYPETFAWKWE